MTTADREAPHAPSRGCYQRGCQADACADANYRYSKRLSLEHGRGERRLRDATQVRAHIERLIAKKWWEAEIARAAGTNKTTIGNIRSGQAGVSKRIALGILSIPVAEISRTQRGERQDPTGSIRRLQALAVIGHPWATISTHTGITGDRLGGIVRGITDGIRPDEARKIADVYRLLSTASGGNKQVATNARKKGWHGPLAWDDIDDPQARPEKAKPYRPADKYRRDPDRTREIEHLYLLGESPQQIAKKVGGNEKYISDQLGAVLYKRAAKAEQERLAAKRQRKQVAA